MPLRDDRGRPFRLRFRGVPIAARTSGVTGERRHRVIELGWLSMDAVVLAFVVGIALLVARLAGWPATAWARIVLGLLSTMLLVWSVIAAVSWAMLGRGMGRSVGVLMERRGGEGRCRGCAFELEGLRPEDDGCTVCPECGAAWCLGEASTMPHE